jgi:hypothetical protein
VSPRLGLTKTDKEKEINIGDKQSREERHKQVKNKNREISKERYKESWKGIAKE